MKRYVIINVGPDETGGGTGDYRLSERRRPTYVHLVREKAEKECCRLAAAYPAGTFVLFEAVMMGEVIKQIEGVFAGQEEWAKKHGVGWNLSVAKLVPVPEEWMNKQTEGGANG